MFFLFVSYETTAIYSDLPRTETFAYCESKNNVSWFIDDIPLMLRQFNVKKLQSLFVPASF